MKRPEVPLTLLLILPVLLLTACAPSNNVTAKVDSQGGQVTITAGSGNVVESKQNPDQVQKELELKNKEIELAKKEAELANREKALAEQRLADAQKEKLDKASSSDESTDNDGGSAPIVKQRRQPVRPRPQASCCEQSSYYSTPSYPTTRTATPSYQSSSNYQPASSYQSVPSQSVSSYTTPSQPQVTRAEPVAEYAEQTGRSSNTYQREGINSSDDKPKKKSFWKKAWPWIAVGAGAAAGVAIAKRR